MKLFWKTKEQKMKLAVFGRDQNFDWKFLFKTFSILLIVAISFGVYFYYSIIEEIGRDPKSYSPNKKSINTEKADKIISDFEVRKKSFENFQLK